MRHQVRGAASDRADAPDGTVLTALYSSGAIGRLMPEDVLGLLKYAKN